MAWRVEAREIAEFGQDRHRRDRRHPVEAAHQRLDRGAQRPALERVMHLGFEPGRAGLRRPDRVHIYQKDHRSDRTIESVIFEPVTMRLRLARRPPVDPAMAEKKRSQTLPGLELDRRHVRARTDSESRIASWSLLAPARSSTPRPGKDASGSPRRDEP